MSIDYKKTSKDELDNPFHKGEMELQARANASDGLPDMARRFITNDLPKQHQAFFSMLPMVFVAAEDKNNDIWSSTLFGEPGFIVINDAQNFTINAQFSVGDPIATNLSVGDEMGLLGIQFETRRRNRVSAKLTEVKDSSISLNVKQCYGNCPKYIQRRKGEMVTPSLAPESIPFDSLDIHLSEFIQSVDSLFIASQHVDNENAINQGVDSSHRGGMPGFVQVTDAKTLLIPDYMGNNFFNTLGNISLDPRTGIQFLDYENGHRVMLTGNAETVWATDEELPFEGVDRMIRFTLKHGYHLKNSFPFVWEFESYSPFSKAYSGQDLDI